MILRMMMMIKIIGLSYAVCPGEDCELVDFGCRDMRERLNQAYPLALSVQGRGGLIQQQDLGVTDDRPGDGNALFLAAGEL